MLQRLALVVALATLCTVAAQDAKTETMQDEKIDEVLRLRLRMISILKEVHEWGEVVRMKYKTPARHADAGIAELVLAEQTLEAISDVGDAQSGG